MGFFILVNFYYFTKHYLSRFPLHKGYTPLTRNNTYLLPLLPPHFLSSSPCPPMLCTNQQLRQLNLLPIQVKSGQVRSGQVRGYILSTLTLTLSHCLLCPCLLITCKKCTITLSLSSCTHTHHMGTKVRFKYRGVVRNVLHLVLEDIRC